MSRTAWAVAVAVGIGPAAGCTSKNTGPVTVDRKDVMAELGQALKILADEGRKPPAKQAELDAIDPLLPLAGPAVRNGEIVYVWGAGYAAGGTQVIAYEKAAAESGGYVLLQDGTVKRLSAAEFQSAPKAR